MERILKWLLIGAVAVVVTLFVGGALFGTGDTQKSPGTGDQQVASSGSDSSFSSDSKGDEGDADGPVVTEDEGPTIQRVGELPTIPDATRNRTDEARHLYKRLMAFKDERQFHECGFGACGNYDQWQDAVHDLSDRATTDFMRYMSFAVMDLTMVATEYMNTRGAENDTTQSVRATIEAGLKRRPDVEPGEGFVIQTDRVCKSMEPLNEFARAMNNENFDKRILVEPECPRVYRNTVVKGPLDRAQDINGSWFFKVRTDEHGEIWIGDGQVAFRKPADGE